MKKQAKEKEQNNAKGLVIFLIVLVIISFAIGTFLTNLLKPKPQTEYSNGFTFTKIGNYWYTDIKNPELNVQYHVEFRYPPSQVANVTVEGNPRDFFNLLNLNNLTAAYFTFNPNDNLTYMNVVAADISKFANSLNGVTFVAACTENVSECSDRPIVTCQSEEGKSLVVYVKTGNETKVSMQKNCLTIEGSGTDLLRASNKLLFVWYGII